jgi:hypothetical protein
MDSGRGDLNMIVHGYMQSGDIEATFNGVRMSVPDASENRHRQIISEWEHLGNTIPPFVTPPPSIEDVIAERERRLSSGFDYDFGDSRGGHRIGSTDEDMRRWVDEVTPISQAMINAGRGDEQITIVTNTGGVVITALEWQLILIAAGQHRQPIYSASFALQSMSPIPEDYKDDSYWTV